MATLFRYMEADLYNLQPAIGEVNGLRSNYSMEMIPGEKREFGACDVEIEIDEIVFVRQGLLRESKPQAQVETLPDWQCLSRTLAAEARSTRRQHS